MGTQFRNQELTATPEPEISQEPSEFAQDLFEEHSFSLKKFLYKRLPTVHDTEDVFQETFLRLLRMNRVDYVKNKKAFLFTVAANIVRDWRRRDRFRKYSTQVEIEKLELPSDVANPEQQVDAIKLAELLDRAVLESPKKSQRAFILHRFGNNSYAEIAEKMGISVKMVEHHISTVLAHCRAKIAKEEQ